MPTIKVDTFGGILPKIHPTLIPDECAIRAHNCFLKSGKLVPLRQPKKVANMRIRMENGLSEIADAKTVYLWHRGDVDEMLAWPGIVNVAASNIADDEYHRLFVSGQTGVGVHGTDPCVYLATSSGTGVTRYSIVKPVLPAPIATAQPIPEGEENIRYTVFFQSWVDKYGYESSVNDVSDEMVYDEDEQSYRAKGEVKYVDGSVININSAIAPEHAVKRRFYKVVAGTESESIQFIAEQSLVAGTFPSYSFRVLDEDAGEVMPMLVSATADLVNITTVPGGFFAGFKTSNLREVRFSEVNLPTSWPDSYAYSVHDDVVGLGVTLNSVFVLTRGMPWVLTGTAPESMSASVLASPQGCVSKRSICVMDGSVFYASADGICMLQDGVSTVTVVTGNVFSKREWSDLKPSSCIMVPYDGALHFWFLDRSDAGGYIINFRDGKAAVTTNDEVAKAVCVDPVTDKLYFIREVK